MNKIKNIIMTLFFAVLVFSLSATCFLKSSEELSQSERRPLAQMPELNAESVFNGEFTESFEEYTADQFPKRDTFRAIKAFFSTKILGKWDNNGLYTANGHISKIDEAENEYMMDYAATLFKKIIDTNIVGKNANVYFSIVPDKNCFLAPEKGYPSLDYNGFVERMKQKTSFMEYIDILPLLSADDYYTTDTHWKQESIMDVAQTFAQAMGTDVTSEYTVNTQNSEFYGVYAGQYALPFKPDILNYLTNETINNCKVTYYDTGLPVTGEMYNMKKAQGKDPYEMFLSGSAPVVTIENPFAETDKELVMFRDSFGSSLAPLMAEGYKKITVVDIRYIQSGFVGNFVDFENCDVLFIYSTALLNNSLALK